MNGNQSDALREASLRRQALCDLMDGEADADTVQRACAAWRMDATAREDWHAFHVIGDVLRTDDLAPTMGAQGPVDAAFLAALRVRLAQEPVVMAPAAVASAAPSAPMAGVGARPAVRDGDVKATAWRTPVAMAAGFLVVAGVVGVLQMRGAGWGSSEPVMALVPPTGARAVVGASASSAAPSAPPPAMLVNDQRMIRDARLDRYLAQHRQFSEGAVATAPGGVVRSVSTTAPDR